MMTMNRNKKAIDRIVQRLSREWQKDAESAISRLYDLLDSGKKTAEAISVVRGEYPKLFTLTNIRPALVEAAAYGYGIMPSVLTSTQKSAWSEALATPWDASGMTLSAKLHGADVKMREAIADTIRDQMNRNAAWTDAATALYDGYGKGSVVRTQELPRYLSAVRYATKGSPEALKSARRAIANIEQLARKGSPTKALKASYMQLIDAAKNGTAEELEKACYVAIEEKSRYVAQRIIRTETARAYSDGFVAEMDADDDVVAVRLRLSTRHPVFDICDFFADADMYGLGKGVYPKDKAPPIPLHPHCTCRLEEVFSWELDISKAKNQVKQAGDKWLNGLTDRQRREVLGITGDKAWQDGASWEKYLRNWKGLTKPETRLKDFSFNLQIHAQNDKIKVDKVISGHDAPPKVYKPNKVIDRVGTNDKVNIRAFYNERGVRYKDIHTTSHGNPKTHPFGKNGEHVHIFTWDGEGNLLNTERRELTQQERKENKDIL